MLVAIDLIVIVVVFAFVAVALLGLLYLHSDASLGS